MVLSLAWSVPQADSSAVWLFDHQTIVAGAVLFKQLLDLLA